MEENDQLIMNITVAGLVWTEEKQMKCDFYSLVENQLRMWPESELDPRLEMG